MRVDKSVHVEKYVHNNVCTKTSATVFYLTIRLWAQQIENGNRANQNRGTTIAHAKCIPGGVLPKKFGGGVQPAYQNPYPIYDQNLQYPLPYLWPDQEFETLFMTWPLNQHHFRPVF